MDTKKIDLLAKKFKRLRTLGDANPFCRICGQNDWWVRYERHHPGRRKFTPDVTLLVCIVCHDRASLLQEDLKMTDHLDREIRRHVLMLEGLADLLTIVIEWLRHTAAYLRGATITPRPLMSEGEAEQ